MEDGEGSSSLMQEEQIRQAARAKDTDDLAREPREVSRYKIRCVLIVACHHRGPNLGCKAEYKSPEDDRWAAKLVRQWEPDESTCRQASGGGGVLISISWVFSWGIAVLTKYVISVVVLPYKIDCWVRFSCPQKGAA